ncbi:Glutamyl-Q tRNA(Asp) synthetase [hydrothermal vent metagenome]|uniref:Glutamyl-Q tRNA(Asp) synthetase n=1 Tax=hydrothermal vent metagenome TaxID=652676 RepID=A0A3B1A7G3_9ZZZZ
MPAQNPRKGYRGRFAPSPSGPLHFGSLLAATASYLQAKQQQGEWWLRIEDIDPPREVKGASQRIIDTLALYGFEWDTLSYQSERLGLYQHYLDKLQQTAQAYHCGCSRKEIQQFNQQQSAPAGLYPGTCRQGLNGKPARAIRIKITEPKQTIHDAIQGTQSKDLSQTSGDFIIKRADGLFSYQLAVAIDDSTQEMTQIVRGCDLHESSFCQQYIQKSLGLRSPSYAHIPVVASPNGIKLSKRAAAQDIATESPQQILWLALDILGQQPPASLKTQNLKHLWQWGFTNWNLANVPQAQSVLSPL